MYFVIAGSGRVGAQLSSALAADGHDVVVVDSSREAFRNLGPVFDGVTLVGNAIDEDVLREAGIEDADGFAAVTSNDNVNLMAAQIARELFGVTRVVARVNEPSRQSIFADFGLETVCATELGAAQLKTMLLSAGVSQRAALGAGEVIEVQIVVSETHSDRTLAEMELPGKFRIAAVLVGGVASIPTEFYRSVPGDVLVGAVRVDALDTVRHMFGIEQTRAAD